MSDTVKSWIEERRAIHTNRHVKRSAWSEATRDWAAEFPRALDALHAVLELHKPVASLGFSQICMICMEFDNPGESDSASFVQYPCPTVQAIEGAINHE